MVYLSYHVLVVLLKLHDTVLEFLNDGLFLTGFFTNTGLKLLLLLSNAFVVSILLLFESESATDRATERQLGGCNSDRGEGFFGPHLISARPAHCPFSLLTPRKEGPSTLEGILKELL